MAPGIDMSAIVFVIAASRPEVAICGPGSALEIGPHAHAVTIAVATTATACRTHEDRDRPRTDLTIDPGWNSSGLMRRGVPTPAEAHADLERHVQRVGVAHLLTHQLLDVGALAFDDLEQKLVVDLQQHARRHAILL
jgi:hypothetical protein